jgi:hypothetical protein
MRELDAKDVERIIERGRQAFWYGAGRIDGAREGSQESRANASEFADLAMDEARAYYTETAVDLDGFLHQWERYVDGLSVYTLTDRGREAVSA